MTPSKNMNETTFLLRLHDEPHRETKKFNFSRNFIDIDIISAVMHKNASYGAEIGFELIDFLKMNSSELIQIST